MSPAALARTRFEPFWFVRVCVRHVAGIATPAELVGQLAAIEHAITRIQGDDYDATFSCGAAGIEEDDGLDSGVVEAGWRLGSTE